MREDLVGVLARELLEIVGRGLREEILGRLDLRRIKEWIEGEAILERGEDILLALIALRERFEERIEIGRAGAAEDGRGEGGVGGHAEERGGDGDHWNCTHRCRFRLSQAARR